MWILKKPSQISVTKLQRGALLSVALLIVAVLVASGFAHDFIVRERAEGSFALVENAVLTQRNASDAPTGVVNEYRFTLGDTCHADALAFFINHHHISVYIDGSCVYRVTGNGKLFRTTGGVYAVIPLTEDDSGKEVLVALSPLYANYQNESVDILIGSEAAIYRSVFLQAIPEMVLSLCIVLTGLFLLSIAIYQTVRQNYISRMYAVGALSIFAGIWRFTYGKFIYLLLPEHAVAVYTLSVISLMVIALAMLNCAEMPDRTRGKTAIRCASVAYCLIYLTQLALQLFGICDLRQCLTATHVTLLASAVVLFVSGLISWTRKAQGAGRLLGRSYSWLLGVGVIVDLLLYYFSDSSAGMLITLAAILIYSLMEGIRLFLHYIRQKSELEEMQTHLMLSRTTTMMSQIRSHFVFNILNAISGMCKYDPEKADETVVRFARYLRANISIMENDANIPFATDLQQLEDYVMLEQVRFGDKLEFYTDIETDDFLIPPLILQPVVENAIKHGVSKKLGNGTIILRTRDTGASIVITVEDDGVGFDMAELDKPTSVGIRNIRFRLEQLVNGTLELQSRVGIGTTATITIPKKGN